MNTKKIYMVGGSKGGVGKSFITMALIDYRLDQGDTITMVETDTSNPDVAKVYSNIDNVKVVTLDLDKPDGWIELVNISDSNKKDSIIVNTAARNNTGMEKYGETLRSTLDELNRELLTLWVINRQRDSLELLRSFLNTFPDALVHVIMNNYFGSPEKFELYAKSKTKEIVAKKGGLDLNFPELADRVADDIYTQRLTIKEASEKLPLGNRAELKRWKGLVTTMFDSMEKK